MATDKPRKERAVRKLNQIAGLESGLLRRNEMNIKQRGIGKRPAARGKWGYIHSSWTGFINDYRETLRESVLKQTFANQVRKIYAENQDRINTLREVSTTMKVESFGGQAHKPIEEAPVINAIYHENQFVRDLQRLSSLVNWSAKDFGKLGELNRALLKAKDEYGDQSMFTKAARQDFYSQYAAEVNSTLQSLFDTLGTAQYKDQLPRLKQILQSLKTRVDASDHTTDWYNSSKFIDALPVGAMSSMLGKEWERVLKLLLNKDLDHAGYQLTSDLYKDIHNNAVADLFRKDLVVQSHIKSSAANLQAGISAKFRRQSKFTLQASVVPSDVINSLVKKDSQGYKQLRFVYNNWVALSTFDSRDYRGHETEEISSKHKDSLRKKMSRGGTFVRKDGSVQTLKPSTLVALFEPLAQYINLYMLNTAFWGNTKDANDITPFNSRFFEEMDNHDRAVPAVILTKRHAYETCDVFQYYNDIIRQGGLLWSVADLFTGLLRPSTGFRPVQLAEHYGRKVKLLRDKKYRSEPIYRVLMRDSEITGFTINAFENLMQKTATRKLKISFALKASY